MPTTEPNDDIGDGEHEDAIMGKDIEDIRGGSDYEEVDMGYIGSSSITEFWPTPAQSQINLVSVTWTEDDDLGKGLVFPNKEGVHEALKIFSIKRHVDYNVTRFADTYIECKSVHHEQGCKWRVKACHKANLHMWMITKYDVDHTCESIAISKDHSKLASDVIANMLADLVAQKEGMAGVAKGQSPGVWMLGGLTVDMSGDDSVVQLKWLFWAFKPCIDAWWHLKPMLQVDGTFKYGKHKHSLLIAMGQDGNKKIVPIAFTLVEGETEATWSWFLWRLREHVTGTREVCLIFDWGIKLLAALDNLGVSWQPPQGHNVFCIRRMASNLNTKFRYFNEKRQQVQAQTARTCKITLQNYEKREFEIEEPYNKQLRRPDRRCRVYLRRGWLDNMLAAYSQQFHPIGGEEYWPHILSRTMKLNPVAWRPPGQARSSRIRNEMDWKEMKNKPKCSLCRLEGHSKKKSPNRQPM
ncbi:hypothetical protein G2W53_040794 [Senna tora]|uniref:MULE transposase domain-containing protein n=1 Tax=Senna tora TaxID=362788 RepID=A0A834SDV1_9FABA|nr:hypothetical protein G2W53_040794 [Senna tora]